MPMKAENAIRYNCAWNLHSDIYKKGPRCSKLTTLSVNVPIKFQTLYRKYTNILIHSPFSTQNISVFGYAVLKHLMS